jgi:hypothetical protein
VLAPKPAITGCSARLVTFDEIIIGVLQNNSHRRFDHILALPRVWRFRTPAILLFLLYNLRCESW